MVSKLSQFCHIVIYCIEHYSKRYNCICSKSNEKLIDKHLPGKELLNEIKKLENDF